NSSRRHPRKFGQKRFLVLREVLAGKWGGLFLGYLLLGKDYRRGGRGHLLSPRGVEQSAVPGGGFLSVGGTGGSGGGNVVSSSRCSAVRRRRGRSRRWRTLDKLFGNEIVPRTSSRPLEGIACGCAPTKTGSGLGLSHTATRPIEPSSDVMTCDVRIIWFRQVLRDILKSSARSTQQIRC